MFLKTLLKRLVKLSNMRILNMRIAARKQALFAKIAIFYTTDAFVNMRATESLPCLLS